MADLFDADVPGTRLSERFNTVARRPVPDRDEDELHTKASAS
jgi:hypothetical protein